MAIFKDFISKLTESTNDTGYDEYDEYQEESAGSSRREGYDPYGDDTFFEDDYNNGYEEAYSQENMSRKSGLFGGFGNVINRRGARQQDEYEESYEEPASYQAPQAPVASKIPEIKTFCPMRSGDATAILNAIMAKNIVHVKLDQIFSSDMSKEEKDETYLKILFATSGCAYAMHGKVSRIDVNTNDYLVIPEGIKYESQMPGEFQEMTDAKYNIFK